MNCERAEFSLEWGRQRNCRERETPHAEWCGYCRDTYAKPGIRCPDCHSLARKFGRLTDSYACDCCGKRWAYERHADA